MQEITSSPRAIRIAPAVFLAALSLAFLTGVLLGAAPELFGFFSKFMLFWVCIPVCVMSLLVGTISAVRTSSVFGLSQQKKVTSYVLSPEDLARWRSIKRGMDRHEVTAILGQPDGPPKTESIAPRPPLDPLADIGIHISGKVCYVWGQGRVWFEPNAGPVAYVKIPEYV